MYSISMGHRVKTRSQRSEVGGQNIDDRWQRTDDKRQFSAGRRQWAAASKSIRKLENWKIRE